VKKIYSFLVPIWLILFVLVASTSWTFASHYCGNIKIDTALFGTPRSCGMMLAKMFDQTNTKPSCCNELEELVAGQKLFNQSLTGVSFRCIFYAANPLVFSVSDIIWSDFFIQIQVFKNRPPLSSTPIYIYTQEFLI
jgi:hypothetical protein